MLWQQSVYRPDQIIVMIVFMVFYFQGHKTDLDFTQKAFVNLYIIAVMWCFVSANRLELIVWLSSLALIVPGGLALNFQR
jgi:intracellular septation protein A